MSHILLARCIDNAGALTDSAHPLKEGTTYKVTNQDDLKDGGKFIRIFHPTPRESHFTNNPQFSRSRFTILRHK
jgi:hypothetical protein